ncbi:hypothetical protein ACJBU6_11174 [Exserohilum turcicum]
MPFSLKIRTSAPPRQTALPSAGMQPLQLRAAKRIGRPTSDPRRQSRVLASTCYSLQSLTPGPQLHQAPNRGFGKSRRPPQLLSNPHTIFPSSVHKPLFAPQHYARN